MCICTYIATRQLPWAAPSFVRPHGHAPAQTFARPRAQVTQLFDAALAPSGLKATQFTLLVTSRLSGEATINGLAQRMAMDRTTLSRNLKPLVRDGLLEVCRGGDGRTR